MYILGVYYLRRLLALQRYRTYFARLLLSLSVVQCSALYIPCYLCMNYTGILNDRLLLSALYP